MSTVFIVLLVILLIFVGIILFVNIGVRFAMFTASTIIDIIKNPKSLFAIMCFIVLAILALLVMQKSPKNSSYRPGNNIPVATEYKRSPLEKERTHFNTSVTNTSTRETQEEPVHIEETPEHKPIMDLIEDASYTEVVYDAQGNEYKTVKIGNQLWMAENLNLETPGSWCYENNPSNCKKYGRLYTWHDAMEYCPDGWHLPSDDEWVELKNFVDDHNGDEGVGTSLQSTNGWEKKHSIPLGSDRFGFSGKPSGYMCPRYIYADSPPEFIGIGSSASFWSSTRENYNGSIIFHVSRLYGGTGFATRFPMSESKEWKAGSIANSVRCVKHLSDTVSNFRIIPFSTKE